MSAFAGDRQGPDSFGFGTDGKFNRGRHYCSSPAPYCCSSVTSSSLCWRRTPTTHIAWHPTGEWRPPPSSRIAIDRWKLVRKRWAGNDLAIKYCRGNRRLQELHLFRWAKSFPRKANIVNQHVDYQLIN